MEIHEDFKAQHKYQNVFMGGGGMMWITQVKSVLFSVLLGVSRNIKSVPCETCMTKQQHPCAKWVSTTVKNKNEMHE